MDFANLKSLTIPEGEVAEITCNGVLLWKGGYTNIIETVGYTNGKRLSTSTGELKDATGYTTTGLIDITNATKPTIIRTSGVDFSQSYSAIVSYEADGTTPKYMVLVSNLISAGHATLDANGNLTLNVTTWISSAICLRLCGYGDGANLIVTINEEIDGYTNLAEPLPNNTTDTTKWVNGYRFSSSGISAQSGTTLTNPIACKAGDVIRIKGVTFRNSTDRYSLHFVRVSDSADVTQNEYFNGNTVVGAYTILQYDGVENGVYKYTLPSQTAYAIKDIRFAMPTPTDVSAVIITVNEEIDSSNSYNNLADTDSSD